jgi:hypothetical protein
VRPLVPLPGDIAAGYEPRAIRMTTPDERPGEPSVYARLASQADMRLRVHRPPRGTRLAGWLICIGVAIVLVVAAVRVPLA